MRMSIGGQYSVFPGEDGDVLEVHFTSAAQRGGVALVVAEGFSDDRITAVLDTPEVSQLHDDICTLLNGGQLAKQSAFAYYSDAQSLRVVSTNRGEPYRVGVELTLVYDASNSVSVFLEQREAARLRNLLNKIIKKLTSLPPEEAEIPPARRPCPASGKQE